MFDFLTRKHKKDILTFYHEYNVTSGYSTINKLKMKTLEKILMLFKKKISIVSSEWNIYIESKYNNIIYPMFDLDNITNKANFEIIYKDVPYVLFQSSVDHYWGILGIEDKNIFTNTIWLSCNDTKYVDITKKRKLFVMRGLYKKLSRKPTLIKRNGIFDENFQKFINSLVHFHNNEALELSILKYKDPKMLLKFDRKRKLEQIEINES